MAFRDVVDLTAIQTPTSRGLVTELLGALEVLQNMSLEPLALHCSRLGTNDQLHGFLDFVRPKILGALGRRPGCGPRGGLFTDNQQTALEAMPPFEQLDILTLCRCTVGNLFNHTMYTGNGWRIFKEDLLGNDIETLSVDAMVERIKNVWHIPLHLTVRQLFETLDLQWVYNAQPYVNNSLGRMLLQLYLVGVLGWNVSHILDKKAFNNDPALNWMVDILLASPYNLAIQDVSPNFHQARNKVALQLISGRNYAILGGIYEGHPPMSTHAFLNVFKGPLKTIENVLLLQAEPAFAYMGGMLHSWMGHTAENEEVISLDEAYYILRFVERNKDVDLPPDTAPSVDWHNMSATQGMVAFAAAIMAYIRRHANGVQ
jgi:hypothetical protein